MILSDQPMIFPSDRLTVRLSSVSDGSMKDGAELMTPAAVQHREAFLRQHHISPSDVAVFAASFETNDYCRYDIATPGVHIGVDALALAQPGRSVLLPLADCTGAVLYDARQHIIMVSHLGRHSTEQFGAERSVAYLTEKFASNPTDLLVWLSPSPNGDDYPLWAFNNRSFTTVLTEQFIRSGVLPENIEASGVDTASSRDYFSHSQFLKGKQDVDGRYAIVATLL